MPLFPLAFSTLGCPNYDAGEVIALAQASGFAGVEIRHLRGTVDLPSLPEFSTALIGETRKRFDDAGVAVVGINSGVRMTSLDPQERRRQLASARANAAIAQGLGAGFLRVFGGPIPKDQDREQTLDAIALGLAEVAELTAAHGVTAVLETHDDFSTSASIQDLYARGAGDQLAVLWDTLHSYRHGETGDFTWSRLGDRIRHVHLKDARTATADGFDFALTGEGSIPIGSFLETLRRGGYGGYVSFEWEKAWHPEIEAPEIAIPHFARFMAALD